MSITLTFNQPGAGIPAGSVDRGRTDIKSTGAIGDTRAYPVTITIGNIPATATVDVLLLDEPPESNPLLTELAPETWQLDFDTGCWGPFRVRVTATINDAVVGSVTRRISIRSPGYHIDYPALAERYDPNATAVPTVPSVELTEMNEGSTNRPLVDFHRQLLEAIEGTSGGGGGVIPDGSITEDKLAPELSDNLLRADGTIPFTQDQDAAGHTVGNLGTPTLAGDAVPLWYVQTSFALSGIHMPCRLVATTPVTASNTQVIDGKSTVNGQRILLTAQASPIDNGLYVANDAGAWLRAPDADTSAELMPGLIIFATDGTAYAETGWILASDAPIAIGTSPLTFARFTGAAQVVAGAGLTKNGDTLDVVAHADGSIVVAADSVQVGVLASDAQHGARAGGTQHAAATTAVAGFQSAADKLKLDGVATGAAALASSAPASVGTANAVGAGTTAARSDHVHAHGAQADGTLHAAATTTVAGFQSAADKLKLDGVATGAAALTSSAPAAVAFTGAVGVGTTAARSDHVHAHGAQTDGTLHAAATTTVAGFQSAADKLKLDGVATSAAALSANAPTQITVTTAAVGVETAAAKGDHTHSVSIGAPSALAVGGAQNTGSATSLPRSDHQHAMPDVATTSVAGFLSASDKTRLDGMATGAAALTSTAPVAVDNAAAVLGVGTTAARHDHKHTVSIGTPVALAVGGASGQGSATTLTRSDHTHGLPSLVTTSVDGFMAAADKLKLDGVEAGAQVTSFARVQTALAAATGSVSFNAQRITSVADPSATQDVVTRGYLETLAGTFDAKPSCRLVTTTNITLSGLTAIDGITPSGSDRILVTGQTTASANGLYTAAVGAWARATDADTSAKVSAGLTVRVNEGTLGADTLWILTTNDPITLGTTGLVFAQAPSTADKTKIDGIEAGAQVVTFARVQTALGVASSAVSFNSQKITNVLDPTSNQEVATKAYVDAIAQGLDVKTSVRLVATTNVATLSGSQTIDGIATAPADRVLLTSQTSAAANGIYLTAAGSWARAADADSSADVTAGMYTFVVAGAANADSGWALITPDPIVLGTTPLTFTQVTGAGQITAGAGLTKTGNTLDVVAHADGSIVVAADSVQLGVIATDAQHGARAGGTTHAAVIAAGASGFMTGVDKTKLDGVATGAAAVGSTTPIAADVTAAAAGSATTAARSDHRHQVTAGSPVALTLAAATADGTSTSLARADHVHALPASSTTPTALTVGGAGSAGSSTSISKADHVHAMPATATTGADGFMASGDKSRLDALVATYKTAVRVASTGHIPNVDIPGNQPNVVDGISLAVGDRVLVKDQVTVTYANNIYSVTTVGTGSNGTWAKAADADATGELVTGSTVYVAEGTQAGQSWQLTTLGTITIGTTAQTWARQTTPLATVTSPAVGNVAAAVGVGTTAARQDHTHLVSSGTPVALTLAGSTAAGSATTLALSDHVHALPATATAVSLTVAGANAPGSAVTLARSDHVHALPDAASAAYVDALPIKVACRVVATAPITLSGLQTIDGILVSATNRVLVIGQASWQTNGIYLAAAGAWARSADADTSAELPPGMLVPVGSEGTTYHDTLWQMHVTPPVSLGSSAMPYGLVSSTLASVASPNVSAAAAAIGSSITNARQDHTHQVTSGTPVALTLAGSTAPGSATTLALSDHVHALPATAAPAALTVGAASSAGAAVTLPRSDHVHAMPGVATPSTDGFLSAADKTRLDALRARSFFDVRLATATTLPAYTATTISTNRPRLTATANGALSIDGVAVVAGDLVLVLFEAVANCGVYEVIVAGTAGTPYQLDLAYSGAYTAAVSGSQMIVRTGTAGYAYCNRQFRPGSTSSGLYVEIPGALQVWPRDTTPPTTIYPGWLYELDLLGSSTVSLTLVSPSGSEQVLRGVRFGINHGAPITTLTITPSTPSRIDSPYSSNGPTGGVPTTSTTYSAIGGSSTTWVCGRGYTSYNPDSPYWKVDTAYGLAAESVTVTGGRVDIIGSAPVAGSLLTGRNSGQAWFVPPTVDPSINGFRLAPTADDSVAADGSFTLLYLAPVTSDRISLYDTTVSDWRTVRVNGFGQAVSGRTTGTPFDVFLQLSAAAPTDGTAAGVTMVFLNWTSASARATAIAQTNGVWVKSGDPTQRYLGTVYPRSATTYSIVRSGYTTTTSKCDIWNNDNRRSEIFWQETAWTGSLATSSANTWFMATTGHKFEFITGRAITPLDAQMNIGVNSAGVANAGYCGIALNSTTPAHGGRAATTAGEILNAETYLYYTPPVGYNFLNFMLLGTATSVLFYTTDDPAGAIPIYWADAFTRYEY